MRIRQAVSSDFDAIAAFDHIARIQKDRRDFIRRSITEKNAIVSLSEKAIQGYAVLEYTFYGNGFISMLYVAREYRRKGIGTQLMRHLEGICTTPKLFTSTNQSNHKMQALLDKMGYERSGTIENLDEGDPEWVYFKRLVG